MANLKLISVRIDPETLDKVEKLAADVVYWKRSTIISNIVTAVFDNADEEDIMKLVRYWPHFGKKLKISVEDSRM